MGLAQHAVMGTEAAARAAATGEITPWIRRGLATKEGPAEQVVRVDKGGTSTFRQGSCSGWAVAVAWGALQTAIIPIVLLCDRS